MKKILLYSILLTLLGLGIFSVHVFSPSNDTASLAPDSQLISQERSELTSVTFSAGEKKYQLVQKGKLWQVRAPTIDRADTALTELIVQSFLSATVIEPLEQSDFTPLYDLKLNFKDQTASHIAIGKRLPFFEAETNRQAVEIRDLLSHKNYAVFLPYTEQICLDNLSQLRDHRPFFFNPANLLSISQLKESTELLLERTSSSAPWLLKKPLTVRTDREEVKKLIESLYKLKASSVTEASMKPARVLNTIKLSSASKDNKVVEELVQVTLDGKLYSPARNLLFEFTEQNIADSLEFSIDQLRSKTLSSLNLAGVNYIFLNSKDQESPVILQIQQTTNGLRWMYQDLTGWNMANELAVGDFIKTLTQTQFTEFTNRELNEENASHQISIVSRNGETLTYYGDFLSAEKTLHRAGTPTSVILNQEQVNSLSTRSIAWKDTQLWNLSRVNLVGILRALNNSQEAYSYDYLLESWKSQINGENATVDLDELAANSYLEQLENLRATKWLNQEQAKGFRNQPVQLQLTVLEKKYDNNGNNTGLFQNQLTLRAAQKNSVFFYAELDSRPNEPFLLSQDTFQSLSRSLHYEN